MDAVYQLFDRRCRTHTALAKLAKLRRRLDRFKHLGKVLAKLRSPNLEKALTFLDDKLLRPAGFAWAPRRPLMPHQVRGGGLCQAGQQQGAKQGDKASFHAHHQAREQAPSLPFLLLSMLV